MLRTHVLLLSLLAAGAMAHAQAIPTELLSEPTHLVLDRPTVEAKPGTELTYTVSLRNARNQAVTAKTPQKVQVNTPGGVQTVVIPAGQSSASFKWTCTGSGVVKLTMSSGRLRPATALVLVKTERKAAAMMAMQPMVLHQAEGPHAGGQPVPHHNLGAVLGVQDVGGAVAAAAPPPPAPAAEGSATSIQMYIDPRPVTGSALEHSWGTNVTFAALDNRGDLAPVKNDVRVHLNASYGTLSNSDIVLAAGQDSNFSAPVTLTATRAGMSHVEAISTLGSPAAIDVQYLQPLPAKLLLWVPPPMLDGTGASTSNVQVCLLDDAGEVAAATEDMTIPLRAGGLSTSSAAIAKGSSCSSLVAWSAGAGMQTISADFVGLAGDQKSIDFPAFPWYFVWLAAAGGLIGAIVASKSDDLFARNWWSHTWRSLVLGMVLGAVFYLFARFGAVAIPKSIPVDLTKIPVVSGVGASLLGFLGGLLGRKLWGVGGGKSERAGENANVEV